MSVSSDIGDAKCLADTCSSCSGESIASLPRGAARLRRYDGGFSRDWHEAIDLYKELDPKKVEVRGGAAACCSIVSG